MFLPLKQNGRAREEAVGAGLPPRILNEPCGLRENLRERLRIFGERSGRVLEAAHLRRGAAGKRQQALSLCLRR